MKIAIALAFILSGCASLPPGVEMTDDERAACAAAGCSVWTLAELQKLVGIAMRKGYDAGKQRKGELSL